MTGWPTDEALHAAIGERRGVPPALFPGRDEADDPPETSTIFDLVVTTRVQETTDIISVELTAPDGGLLPAYGAGAHVDVHLGDGLVRQYSLCGDPSDRTRYRLAILLNRESRGGSKAAHARLVEGAGVRVGAPRNHFPLREDGAGALLLAGGIGITPLLAMARRLHALGQAFDLHYCTRSRAQTAFADEIATSSFGTRVHVHHDDGDAAQRLDLDRILREHAARGKRPDLYVCGPAGFIACVIDRAGQFGWPEEMIHREYFAAEVDMAGGSFTVEARRSGKTVTVAAGQTIADALKAAGVNAPLSCEEGVCGTCQTRVLDGTPDHRDVYLSASERADNGSIMICCSRSRSRSLALDI
jgi:vanillate O-demethylase ferredoxin subunit